MKSHFLLLLPIFLSVADAAEDTSKKTEAGVLSINDTIAAVLIGPTPDTPWALLAKANPQARDALVKIITDNTLRGCHPNAIRMLGYVGEDADVALLKTIIEVQPEGVLSVESQSILSSVFDSIGILCRRDVDRANNLVKELASVAYWRNRKYSWYSEEILDKKPERRMESLSRFLYGYRLANSDKLVEVLASILRQIDDPQTKAYIQTAADPERLKTVCNKVIDIEKMPVSEDLREIIATVSKNKSEGIARLTAKDSENRQEAMTIISVMEEAMKEYSLLQQHIANENYAGLQYSLLDNGRQIDAEKLHKRWPEYEKDLGVEKKIFSLLQKTDIKCIGYRIDRVQGFAVPEAIRENHDHVAVIKIKEDVIVSFKLNGSGEIGSELFARQKGSLTVADDGTLIVYLMRIDGKWYWNPFGW